MSLHEHDVIELLKQWGAWSCAGLGSGSLETPDYDNVFWIDDEIGLTLDKAVGHLRIADQTKANLDVEGKYKRFSPRYRAITLYYKQRYNMHMLANALNCGADKAALILKAGESFIESQINNYDIQEHNNPSQTIGMQISGR